jgi:hypothetical protein
LLEVRNECSHGIGNYPLLEYPDGIYEPGNFLTDAGQARELTRFSEPSPFNTIENTYEATPLSDYDLSEFLWEEPQDDREATGYEKQITTPLVRAESGISMSLEPIPRRRQVKAPRTRDPRNREELNLHIRSTEPATASFQTYFSNEVDAEEKYQRYLDLYRKLPDECTFPSNDDTFPKSDVAKQALVKKLFDAISDWGSYREWPQVVSTEMRDRFIDNWLAKNPGATGLSQRISIPAEELRPSPEELARMAPPLGRQQAIVLSRELNDQMVEWISWDLLVSSSAGTTTKQG